MSCEKARQPIDSNQSKKGDSNRVYINRDNLSMPKSLRQVLIDLDTLAVEFQLKNNDSKRLQEGNETV